MSSRGLLRFARILSTYWCLFKPSASHPDVVFVKDGIPFFSDVKTAKNAAVATGDREISSLLDEVVSN